MSSEGIPEIVNKLGERENALRHRERERENGPKIELRLYKILIASSSQSLV